LAKSSGHGSVTQTQNALINISFWISQLLLPTST